MADLTLMDINSIVEAENASVRSISGDENHAPLSADEIRAINNRIAEIAENPDVFGVLWKARKAIYRAVAAVKKENPKPFEGFTAEGDAYDLILLRPQDIKRDGTALTTFTTDVTAVGVADYESDTGGAAISLDKYEGRVYCGWADPVDVPKAVGVEIQRNNNDRFIIPTLFSLCKDYPIIQHTPVIIKPYDSYKITVRYAATGTDRLMPVGVRIVPAKVLSL